ncbi:MAG TPA: hypothetical protein VM286_08725 [Candidatus Thermoplasmatota archaeon]|nr:hypothetical protein [Candidatus Thermoplasmatota archaeon]
MAADLEAVAASPFVPFGEDVPEGEELTVFGVPIMDGAEAQYEWMARRALRHILALVAAEAPCHRDAEAVRARLRLASHETGLKKAGMELSRPPATKSAAFEAHSAAPKPQENQEGSPGEAAP